MTRELEAVDWRGIRREYFKVVADLPLVACVYDIDLDDRVMNALGHTLAAMDRIDSRMDRLSCGPERTAFGNAVINWMHGTQSADDRLDCNFTASLIPLRNINQKQGTTKPFLAAAQRVFAASEAKRNANTMGHFIDSLVAEGQAAAEMILLIMQGEYNRGLSSFLRQIMGIGTIVDTLLDARGDYQRGELTLVPGVYFYCRLVLAVIRRGPRLIMVFPQRRLLFRYCLSYLDRRSEPLLPCDA